MAPITKKVGTSSMGKTASKTTGKTTGGKFSSGINSNGKSGSNGKVNTTIGTKGKYNQPFGKSNSSSIGKTSYSLTKPSGTITKRDTLLVEKNLVKVTPPKIVPKSIVPSLGSKPSSSTNTSAFSDKRVLSNLSRKPEKSSLKLGIIWLPTRKNRKKDIVYNPYNYNSNERIPSIMSGDSSGHQPYRKKEEESDIPLVERSRPAIAPAVGVTIAANENLDPNEEEKKELIKNDSKDQDEAGDNNKHEEDDEKDDKSEKDYLDNKEKETEKLSDKKMEDKVDSVFLRQPPPHKSRSTTSTTVEDEDCIIKCLYFFQQCCECVIM